MFEVSTEGTRARVTTADDAASRRSVRPWSPILCAAGGLCVGLAAIGAVLPILPTTPFLLLAAACFARGSKRAHRWLLRNRLFGPTIDRWQRERTISVRAKVMAITLMTLTIAASAIWAVEHMALRIGLAGTCAGVAIFLIRVPSRPSQESSKTASTERS